MKDFVNPLLAGAVKPMEKLRPNIPTEMNQACENLLRLDDIYYLFDKGGLNVAKTHLDTAIVRMQSSISYLSQPLKSRMQVSINQVANVLEDLVQIKDSQK